MVTNIKQIIQTSLTSAISYEAYKSLIHSLLQQKKSTGEDTGEDLYNYSVLNQKRMLRLDKTLQLAPETLAFLKGSIPMQTWLVLSEGWCGDAAQNIPVLNKFAEENSDIDLKIVLRDQHPKLMQEFLTNGSKSIPKLIALDADLNVLGTWGPRPSFATQMVQEYKSKNGQLDADFKKDLQIWYNKDKGKNTEKDLIALLSQ
ncbi:thioredoxin family protein [Tenacibaculum sp. SG-28]|uniref:thioredoxin family protein n=1 Tax=Tenacibaculum sp. SG-28 TaxID=754426 RepID=UPI0018EBF935|nr:thioredoxin family protein [Tenacibaculum sp. SG-28]